MQSSIGDAPLTRKDVLAKSAANALDFNLPLDKRGEIVFVDLTTVHPKGEFTVLTIDATFLPDLKRLKLCLKDGRLYADTFRETKGGWKAHLCPVSSIVAAKKYGRNWDVVLLSARTVGNSLDLRASNVIVPACQQSVKTAKMNAKQWMVSRPDDLS